MKGNMACTNPIKIRKYKGDEAGENTWGQLSGEIQSPATEFGLNPEDSGQSLADFEQARDCIKANYLM